MSRDPQDSPGSQEPAESQETPVCRAGRARPSETKVPSFRGLEAKTCARVSRQSRPLLVLCPFGWPERACTRVVWMWPQSRCVLTRLDALLRVTRAVLSVSWLGGARAFSNVIAKHSNSSRAVPWGQAGGFLEWNDADEMYQRHGPLGRWLDRKPLVQWGCPGPQGAAVPWLNPRGLTRLCSLLGFQMRREACRVRWDPKATQENGVSPRCTPAPQGPKGSQGSAVPPGAQDHPAQTVSGGRLKGGACRRPDEGAWTQPQSHLGFSADNSADEAAAVAGHPGCSREGPAVTAPCPGLSTAGQPGRARSDSPCPGLTPAGQT